MDAGFAAAGASFRVTSRAFWREDVAWVAEWSAETALSSKAAEARKPLLVASGERSTHEQRAAGVLCCELAGDIRKPA